MTPNEEKEKLIAMRRNGESIDRHGQYWTAQERVQLEELFYNGVGISAIALILERSETAVVQQLISCGAFKGQQKSRDRSVSQCRCYKCEKKCGCPFSPGNRENLICTAGEETCDA